jgi:hypothetical protein
MQMAVSPNTAAVQLDQVLKNKSVTNWSKKNYVIFKNIKLGLKSSASLVQNIKPTNDKIVLQCAASMNHWIFHNEGQRWQRCSNNNLHKHNRITCHFAQYVLIQTHKMADTQNSDLANNLNSTKFIPTCSGVPRTLGGGGCNKFSWGQKAERTGLRGR